MISNNRQNSLVKTPTPFDRGTQGISSSPWDLALTLWVRFDGEPTLLPSCVYMEFALVRLPSAHMASRLAVF